MAKGGIRWKSGEQDLLKKEIRRFNERRRRAIKKNPLLYGILPTVSYRDVMKNITTRSDYNRIMRELNWSRAKNAFNIVKVDNAQTTKWELRRTKARLRKINKDRAKELERANVTPSKGTMGTVLENSLLPKKMPKISSQKDWQKFVESVEKQQYDAYFRDKNQIYSENYLKGWETNFGTYRLKEIQKILSGLDYADIAGAMYDNPLLSMNFEYTKDDIELHEKADAIIEAWKYYIETLKY